MKKSITLKYDYYDRLIIEVMRTCERFFFNLLDINIITRQASADKPNVSIYLPIESIVIIVASSKLQLMMVRCAHARIAIKSIVR